MESNQFENNYKPMEKQSFVHEIKARGDASSSLEKALEDKATDMELAVFLIGHINNPCQDLSGNNIRNFYIKEARRALGTMQNPEAKAMLGVIINRYQQEQK